MIYNFKAVTFNVRRDTRLDGLNRWFFRRKYVADIIAASGAVIGGVQELMPHMRDYLEDALSGYKFIGRGRGRRDNNEHSDIIIRKDSAQEEDSHTFWLSNHPGSEGSKIFFTLFPRICTAARIKLLGAERSVYLLNTHFDFISKSARMTEAGIICDYIKEIIKIERLPLILIGDFNASEKSPSIERIKNNGVIPLRSVYNGDLRTVHFFKGGEKGLRCDHMLVSDDFTVENAYVDTTSFNGRWPSDHYPIVAELGLECAADPTEDYSPSDD